MRIMRRLQLIAGVTVGSAVAGALAGLAVASLMLTLRVDHASAAFIWELTKLGTQTGALAGVLLGPPVVFGLLRRVPLGRLAASNVLLAAFGGALGFAVSTAFQQPRPSIALILAGSVAGFSISSIRLWLKTRDVANEDATPWRPAAPHRVL
jgi:hypothetical protein